MPFGVTMRNAAWPNQVSCVTPSAARAEPVLLRQRHRSLAEQCERAADSLALNLAEGRRRVGRDRVHLFRIALGSAEEVRACLRVAEAWGHLSSAETAETLQLLDQELAICFRLTH